MDAAKVERLIDEILRKIPRPNYSELPSLYEELNYMAKKIGKILIESDLFDSRSLLVRFNEADKAKIIDLIKKDPNVMVPFFVMICGFSVRELERLYNIKNVYSLRSNVRDLEKLILFAGAINENLRYPLHIETAIYKFYKNWEEHQKRHYRGHKAEDYVIEILRKYGYQADKVKIICKDKEREIDVAIPPDPQNIRVAIMVRQGVLRDLVKRAKEFSSEFDALQECIPDVKFVVVYFAFPHERDRLGEIRRKIESEREGKRPFDLIILSRKELETVLIKKLEKWNVPRKGST